MTPMRILAAGALAAILSLPAAAQQYAPWQGDKAKMPPAMLDELEAMVKTAERDRAASPDFIGDLYDYIDKYRDALAGPGAPAKFFDNFADGNYTANPAWKVSAGFWSVDRSGNNIGLVSKIRQGANLGGLLGAILAPQGQQQSQAQQQQYAAIYNQTSLPGAFLLKAKLTSGDAYGALSLALFQGASGQNSYRLVYQPGSSQGLVLQQATAQGVKTIAAYDSPLRLEDKRAHEIVWSRDARGRMSVSVDGRALLAVRDTAIKGNFDGILLMNAGGSYWIREIGVEAQS